MSRRLLCGCLVDGYVLKPCELHAQFTPSSAIEAVVVFIPSAVERAGIVKKVQAFREACMAVGVFVPRVEELAATPEQIELLEKANDLQVEIVALCLPQTQEGE